MLEAERGPAQARRLVLHGSVGARAAALDLCHVLSDVVAVCEEDTTTEVALTSGAADLGERLAETGVRVLAAGPARVVTGLEDDVALRVADDLVVRPPWVAPLEGFAGLELIVPRGGAFGSGEHGSTKAALQVLHATWDASRSHTVVDVGTGSGILALYASQRGAGCVLACDIDAPSVRAAHHLTAGTRRVVVLGGPEAFGPGCADLVIANLNGSELHEALDTILALRRDGAGGARCVLSGMRSGAEERSIRARLGGVAAGARRVEVDGYVALGFGG